MIYTNKVRTRTVSEIPHVYVQEAPDRLYGRQELAATAPDPTLQARWEKVPNLVKGDVEVARLADDHRVGAAQQAGPRERFRAERVDLLAGGEGEDEVAAEWHAGSA